MTTLYKLTDVNDQTYGRMQWGPGVTHTATGPGMVLCTTDFIHAYTHPLLAVFLNAIHANFRGPHLWESEGCIVKSDHGLKVGVKTLTTLRRVDLPQPNAVQTIAFGILCAKHVYLGADWVRWANNWLSGKGRYNKEAAFAASAAASAEWAKLHMWSKEAHGAWAAVKAARGEVAVAALAAATAASLDLIAIAQQAMKVKV